MVGIKDAKMPKSCMFCQYHDQMHNRCDVGFFDTNAKFIKGDAKWSFKHPNCPLVEIGPLTDTEKRLFLAAIKREEEICKNIDREKELKDLGVKELTPIVRSIERKVKKALWTNNMC